MNPIESLYKSHDFHLWHEYLPKEKHYANFEPRIIHSLQKVDDVYYAFGNARYNLVMTELEDFGQMMTGFSGDILMIRSNFVLNALNFYNFAIDLSWQVLFFYVSDNSLYFLSSKGEYDKFSNKCNNKDLVEKLKYRREGELLEILNAFNNNSVVRELREQYNYLKHRGTLHINGLGIANSKPYMTIKNGEKDITYSMFVKRSIDIEFLKKKIIELDKIFFDYFNQILQVIVPRDYLIVKDDLLDVFTMTKAIEHFNEKERKRYKELFDSFY